MAQQLNSSQALKVQQWLEKNITNPCPLCDSRSWSYHDRISMAATVDPAFKGVDPSTGMPVIHLLCLNCGFAAPIQASRIGLL